MRRDSRGSTESAHKKSATVFSAALGSFRLKLIALVLTSVMLPSGVIWILTVQDTERFQVERVSDTFAATLNAARRDINYWYNDRTRELDQLLNSKVILESIDAYYREKEPLVRAHHRKRIERYFGILREKFPGYEEFAVLDENGIVAASTAISSPARSLLDSLFRTTPAGRYLSEPLPTTTRDRIVQRILVPVEAPAGRRVAAAVTIDLADVARFVTPEDLSATGDFYILDGPGRYLTQPRHVPFIAASGKQLNMLGRRAASVPSAANLGSAPPLDRYARESFSEEENRQIRTRYIARRLYLPERNWWLVCEDAESSVIAPVVMRKNKILLAAILICGLFLLLAWMLSQRLLGPLAELSSGVRRINAGHPGVQIAGNGTDEVGQMIVAFNEMSKRISETEAKLNRNNRELEKRNADLTDANDKLSELSITDGLTGLFNHRHFWNLVNNELSRANLYQGELGLVLLDIDNFKQVNDRFGHAAGDGLIRRMAELLREVVRETDIVARYGGEEFAILLPDTSRQGVLRVSEELRRRAESLVFKAPDTDITISTTVSIGVSVFRGDRREFFNAADRALYQSKSEGKNRVKFVMAAQGPEGGGEV